jgi:hypothetical protein
MTIYTKVPHELFRMVHINILVTKKTWSALQPGVKNRYKTQQIASFTIGTGHG